MTFSEALAYLYDGKRIARKNWLHKEAYIYIGKEVTFRKPDGVIVMANGLTVVHHNSHETTVGWTPTAEDLFAEDWSVIE